MAATMDITPTDQPPGWRRRLGGFAVSLALGAALLAMASGRVQSELFLLEPGRIIAAAETGTAVPTDVLEAASRQAVQEAGRGLSAHGGDLAGRSQVLLALYQGPQTSAGQATLAAARNSLRQALADAPLAPYAWHRLAYAEYASHRFHEAVAAWYMSVRTGRFDPVLIPTRFESGLVFYPYMDIRSRQAFAEQVRLYAGWGLHALVRHGLRLNAVETIRPFLASQPATLAEFDRLLPLLKAQQ